jgi:hypothetical protein
VLGLDEKTEHVRFMEELSEEKKKTEKKKYFSHLPNVKKFEKGGST